MYDKQIEFSDEMKYLGVIMDSKLNWKAHIDGKIKKVKRSMMMVKNTINHTWGPQPRYAKWVWTGVMRPALTYGSMVWSQGIDNQSKIDKLRAVQRLGLLGIAHVRKSTPTTAMEILYDCTPLDLFIKTQAQKTYCRISPPTNKWQPGKKLGHREYIRRSLEGLELKIMDRIIPERRWENPWETYIGNGKPFNGTWNVYTDGSLLDGRAGAGIIIYKEGTLMTRRSVPMGRNSTVYQAELEGIHSACNILLEKNI